MVLRPLPGEVHVLGELQRTSGLEVYRFALKRPLDTRYYQHLRRKLYGVRTSRSADRAGEPGSEP